MSTRSDFSVKTLASIVGSDVFAYGDEVLVQLRRGCTIDMSEMRLLVSMVEHDECPAYHRAVGIKIIAECKWFERAGWFWKFATSDDPAVWVSALNAILFIDHPTREDVEFLRKRFDEPCFQDSIDQLAARVKIL